MKAIKILVILASVIALVSCSKDKAIQLNSPNQAQQIIPIPNSDFENWDWQPLPQNWKTNSCPFCLLQYETYIVQKVSDFHSGQFAAKFIYNNVYTAWAENKFSIPAHPLSLKGYVKCNLYGTDTVSIEIKIFFNTVMVDSGRWISSSSINNYTEINIPITQDASQIDSASIRIQGGHKMGYPNSNTELWVDDLTFE